MVEAGKSGPMRHTPGSGKTDLDVNGAPPTQAPPTSRLTFGSAVYSNLFYPPVATPAIFPELDCFQALGIKGKRLRGLSDPCKSTAFPISNLDKVFDYTSIPHA